MAIKQKLARKAVKSTAKHTAHGAASKLKREPARALTLLALGALGGILAGWLLGRARGGAEAGSEPTVQPVAPGIPVTPTPAATAAVTGGPS
jgi:hypothetical protein